MVIDLDGTREAARQRALPQTEDLPPAFRRLDEVCAPGYRGRKRGEVVRTRTTVVHWFQGASSPLDLTSPVFDELAHKLTFYVFLAMCARLPDQLEKRGPDQPAIKHRGCTHSCFAIFLTLLAFGFVGVVGRRLLASRDLVLTDFWAKELSVFCLAFVLAMVLHIVADSLTTRKVKLLWPDTTPIGFGLFSNGTPGEYLVLWGYLFLTGILVALGIFGF